jgi:hypothetical protein
MQHGPANGSSAQDAEYDFQELRAQQERAKLLFHCYVLDDDMADGADDYYAYYADDDELSA